MTKNDFKSAALCRLTVTRAVYDLQQENAEFARFINDSFYRYIHCDWGDTCSEDKQLNDMAIKHGERILAVYKHPKNEDWTIWIITEWDRSATTILFPSEY